MSRELKFRIWDKNMKRWWCEDSQYLQMDGKKIHPAPWSSLSAELPDESIVIQQYIGLKDSDGEEIYEGDILTYCNSDDSDLQWFYVVDLYDGSYKNPYTYRRVKGSTISEVVGRSHGVDFKDFKIVGNINEPPMQIL